MKRLLLALMGVGSLVFVTTRPVPAVIATSTAKTTRTVFIEPNTRSLKPKLSSYTQREGIWLNSTAAKCIRFNESTNGRLSRNLYQFQGQTFFAMTGLVGDPGAYSVAVQNDAAYRLYLLRGWQPWATRFVCGLG